MRTCVATEPSALGNGVIPTLSHNIISLVRPHEQAHILVFLHISIHGPVLGFFKLSLQMTHIVRIS